MMALSCFEALFRSDWCTPWSVASVFRHADDVWKMGSDFILTLPGLYEEGRG